MPLRCLVLVGVYSYVWMIPARFQRRFSWAINENFGGTKNFKHGCGLDVPTVTDGTGKGSAWMIWRYWHRSGSILTMRAIASKTTTARVRLINFRMLSGRLKPFRAYAVYPLNVGYLMKSGNKKKEGFGQTVPNPSRYVNAGYDIHSNQHERLYILNVGNISRGIK